MPGWNPYPEPPPGVPEHLVGKVHHVNVGDRTIIGIDPGSDDQVAATLYAYDVKRVTFHYDAPPFVDPAMVAAAVATPPKRTTLADMVAAIAPLMLEEISERINRPYWGILGQLLHRYWGPEDTGDSDSSPAHDQADPMSSLVAWELRDVPRPGERTPLRPGTSARMAAAARLRAADALETEAALLRELQRERDEY